MDLRGLHAAAPPGAVLFALKPDVDARDQVGRIWESAAVVVHGRRAVKSVDVRGEHATAWKREGEPRAPATLILIAA